MPNRTILLIDYDPQSIESAIKPLTGAGYTVEVANDGIAGLQAFQRLQPDLVLIEPMVPKKHGFEVCQEIKGSDQGRSTPVLITTGFYRGRKHQVEAKQFYGCDEYLEKPIAEELLLSTCERYLADEPDEPRLLEDLEADHPATARVPEDGLPELEELSEEEIVARLDDLIKEDPTPAGAAPEPPALKGDSVLPEAEPQQPAEPTLSVAEAVAEPETAEPSPEEPSPILPGDTPLPLGRRGEVAYGSPGTGAEGPDPEPLPEEDLAVTEERPSTSSKRLWLVFAAAALIAVVAAGILLVPRIFDGGEATAIAAATTGPADEIPAPARRQASTEPAGAPVTGAESPAARETSAESPADSPDGPAEPVAAPPRGAERSNEPPVRPEPRQAQPEPRQGSARPTTAQPTPPPPDPKPAEPRTTPALRKPAATSTPSSEPATASAQEPAAQPAQEESGGDAAITGRDPETPTALTGDSPTGAAEPADPIPESPTKGATATPENPAHTASESEEAGVGPEPTPSADPSPEARIPGQSAPAAEGTAPPEPPPVARGTLLDVSQVDTMPQPLDKRPPEYPPLARRLRLEGSVSLRLLVDERGRVTEVETTAGKANTVLVKAAERAAREWTYHPARKGDVPVKIWITERVVFQR